MTGARFVHDRLGLAETARARLGWLLRVIDDAGHVPHIEQTDAFLHALHAALGTKSNDRSRGARRSASTPGQAKPQ
jgi:hypothetical protein